jgi:hypothetical protein
MDGREDEAIGLADMHWYGGELSRTEAEALLMETPSDGEFLVRMSRRGTHVISILYAEH